MLVRNESTQTGKLRFTQLMTRLELRSLDLVPLLVYKRLRIDSWLDSTQLGSLNTAQHKRLDLIRIANDSQLGSRDSQNMTRTMKLQTCTSFNLIKESTLIRNHDSTRTEFGPNRTTRDSTWSTKGHEMESDRSRLLLQSFRIWFRMQSSWLVIYEAHLK